VCHYLRLLVCPTVGVPWVRLAVLGMKRVLVRLKMALTSGSWNPASISALAAIFGSFSGAFASSASTWITQRHQDRRHLLAKRIFYREQLYSDFIGETAHALADAIQHNLHDPNKLTPTYALLSRIRLSSSTKVLASAERVIQDIISRYSEPNLTPEEIQSRATKREDPLRDFSNICRAELEGMQKQLR
jgi:hypothetical protein